MTASMELLAQIKQQDFLREARRQRAAQPLRRRERADTQRRGRLENAFLNFTPRLTAYPY